MSKYNQEKQFLQEWLDKNGVIKADDSEKLSKFMDEFGEYIDNMDYTPDNNGDKLILYSGMNGEIPMYKYAEGSSYTGSGHYYISSTKPGKLLNEADIKLLLSDICDENKSLVNKITSGYNADGSRNPYVIGDKLSLDDRISANLVKNAQGDVTIWAPNAVTGRVLSDTELRYVLTNDNITSINGIDKNIFINKYNQISADTLNNNPTSINQSYLDEIFSKEIKPTINSDIFNESIVHYDNNGKIFKIDTTNIVGGNFEIDPDDSAFSSSTKEIKQFRDDDIVKLQFGDEYDNFTKVEKLQAKQIDFYANKFSNLKNIDINDTATSRYLIATGKKLDTLDDIDKIAIKFSKSMVSESDDVYKLLEATRKYDKVASIGKSVSPWLERAVGIAGVVADCYGAYTAYQKEGVNGVVEYALKESIKYSAGTLATEAMMPYFIGIGAAIGGPVGAAVGGFLAGAVGYGMSSWAVEKLAENINGVFGYAQTISSPIILDLDGNGVQTTNDKFNPHFDLDANGFKEKTGWVDKNDGLLVYDKNEDGIINNGVELFGDNTILSNGQKARHGFEALAELDDNKDGKIDENDRAYSKLKLWIDKDRDAITDEKELVTLKEAGIKSLNTSSTYKNQKQENGNIKYIQGTYEKIDGTKHEMTDYYFVTDKTKTVAVENIKETLEVKLLPNIQGMGNVYSLHQAMIRDEELKNLVTTYVSESNKEERLKLAENIILKWTNTENEDKNKAGQYVDYRQLKAMGELIGTQFTNYSWGNKVGTEQGAYFTKAYKKLANQIDAILQIQLTFDKVIEQIPFKFDEQNIKIVIDNEKFILRIKEAYKQEDITKYKLLKDFIGNVQASKIDIDGYEQLKNILLTKEIELAKDIYNSYFVQGTEKNESLNLKNTSEEFNIVDAGKGSDTIYGSTGDDTYFFELGDGQDTIYESSNQNDFNSIVFGKGITKGNIEVHRINQSDVVIEIKDTKDKITIKGQIGTNPAINKIYFENGQTLTSEEIKNIVNTITTKNDYIEATKEADIIDLLDGDDTLYSKDGDDIIHGNEGNDTIYSENGNDTVYADEGDDKIYAGYGDDIIIGGKGNDSLEGSYGNDTYIFHIGDGQDKISDYGSGNSNLDKISLDKNLKEEDIILKRNGDNLEITFKDNQKDKIIINSQFSSEYYTIEEIHYGENGIINFQEMLDKTNEESKKQNILKGSYTDDTFVATEKDDTITSYYGNDIIIGGKGNDKIDGGYGNDTYHYNLGDGTDEISDSSGTDTLVFGEGITKEDVELNRVSSSDIAINFKNRDERIILKGQYKSDVIDKIEFEDGSTIIGKETRDNSKKTTKYDDYVEGTSGDDTLNAGDGNDTIKADNGDDILIGGKGNDYLEGGRGSDTYIFRRGDGQDIIYDGSYIDTLKNIDKIVLKDINKEDVYFTKESDSTIVIKIKDSDDKITIKNAHDSSGKIEEIHFANGEVMTYEELMKKPFEYYGDDTDNYINTFLKDSLVKAGDGKDSVRASYGNDSIIGGKGNDYLEGGYGSDTYIYSRGDGIDRIFDNSHNDTLSIDKIVFKDITREDVHFTQENETDINIKIKGSSDKIQISSAHDSRGKIEEIHFADGSMMTYEDIMKKPFEYYGDDSDNCIHTLSKDSLVKAGDGNDTIKTYKGDDILIGGKGNDNLEGGYGSDTYIYSRGDGIDRIFDCPYGDTQKNIDKIVFKNINKEDVYFTKESSVDITIKIKDSEDKITIKNAHDSIGKIEEIHFANGEVMTYEDIMNQPFEYYGDGSDDTITTTSFDNIIYAEAGDDKVYADYGNDSIIGGKGNDYLQGGRGSDTYIFEKGDGVDTILDYDTNTNNKDKIRLGAEILKTIFRKDGNNLNIEFADNNDKIKVQNWYRGSSYQIEEIQDIKGNMITNQKVNLLIDYMSGFETQNGVSWNNMAKNNDNDLKNILENFWVKQS